MADTGTGRVKIEFEIYNQDQWYAIIRELNLLFGSGAWRGQKHVKRKFMRSTSPMKVWFEVPDDSVASFLQLKHTGAVIKENS